MGQALGGKVIFGDAQLLVTKGALVDSLMEKQLEESYMCGVFFFFLRDQKGERSVFT